VTEFAYSYRSRWFARERTYRLGSDGFEWCQGRRSGHVAYADVARLDICKERFLGSSATYWRCILYLRGGAKIKLGAASHCGFRGIENRTASYIAFVQELEKRVAVGNPRRIVTTGEPWLDRIEEFAGRLAVRVLRAIRHTNPERWADIAAGVMRRLGPRLRGHRMARAQLAAAFPDKSTGDIEKILIGMWDNLARSVIEYSYLDLIWDADPARPHATRILVDQASADRWSQLLEERRPVIGFAAHLANWELAAIGIAAFGLEPAIPMRTPRIRALADELIRMRKQSGCTPIPSGADTIIEIRNAVKRGAIVGILVDQHHADGIEVTFFGRRCRMNPILVRLARVFNAKIYGARVIRLPDRRFRYEMVGPIEPARDAAGQIEISGTMQAIASIIEAWIREYPDQWMWLHRMWR
jgi:KDO2-lipid IV(A) lauroyltransferase